MEISALIAESPLIVIVVTCVLVYLVKFGVGFATSPLRKIPGPSSNTSIIGFICGQFLDVLREEPCLPHLRWASKYGSTVSYRFFLGQRVLIASPSALKHVLVTNARNYPKGARILRILKGVVGEGLLTTHGKNHKRQRAYLSPAFHFVHHAKFMVVFSECAKNLCQFLSAGEPEAVVDISSAMTKLTLDIIGLAAFGCDFQAQGGSGTQSDILSAYETLFDSTKLSVASFFPWLENLPTPYNRRVRAARETIRSKVLEIIDQKRREADAGEGAEATDLLGLLLKQTGVDEEGNSISTKELDPQELIDQVLTFLTAGHETTSTTLCWALHLLSLNPDSQLRVQAELDAVLEGRAPELHDFDHLPVLKAALDETLRLFPAAAITNRTAIHDDVIDGFKIPAGTDFIISPVVMHRLPSLWANPGEFVVDRWLDESQKDEGAKSPFTYMPFLVGPHGCIGRRFAHLEACTALAALLQQFSFKPVPGRPVKATLRVTQRPTPSLHLIVSRRSAATGLG